MSFLKKLFGGENPREHERDQLGVQPRPDEPAQEGSFIPGNDLERLLLALNQGTAQRSALPHRLVKSRLFLLFNGDPEGVMASETAQPLAIKSDQGYPGICVFSAPERANDLQAQHPEFRTGIETEFAWVLEICPPGVGILINPGSPYTVELHPDGVAPIREGVKRGDFG